MIYLIHVIVCLPTITTYYHRFAFYYDTTEKQLFISHFIALSRTDSVVMYIILLSSNGSVTPAKKMIIVEN